MDQIKCKNSFIGESFAIYNGDSIEITKSFIDNSVGFSIFSPPFVDLYTYSDDERDMANCSSYDEFFQQFNFLASELERIIKPGRSVAIHCMDLPYQKGKHGFIGIRDFPGDIIRLFEKNGFIYHSRVTIWKDPLIEATRTKALGLMHKQLCKDSAICRQGYPDVLIVMRKRGNNLEPINHEEGITEFKYFGSEIPAGSGVEYQHNIWRKYASPVWMDIRQTYTLQKESARDERDEKHICPLQLDVIGRCVLLWSNPGDVILSPFAGIGSEGYSINLNRKFIGIELKGSYYTQAVENLKHFEYEKKQSSLFR
jgi:DNA modification methylase